eukprot:jgi/Psemu1/287599/fgenesh1_pg.201_\
MVRTKNRVEICFVATVLIGVISIFFQERLLGVNDYAAFSHDNITIDPLLISGKTRKEHEDRPWMILHVGPPKTGTTTIRHGLERIALRLAKDDNIYFIGCVLPDIVRIGGTVPTNRTTAKNGNTYDKPDNPEVTMFRVKDFLWPGEPLEEFTDVLRNHWRNKHNVLVSSEILSSEFSNNPRYWKRVFKHLFLSSRVRGDDSANEEPFFGFNVKVVVTYRHFFEWLPSYWAEQHRYLSRIGPPPSSQFQQTGTEGITNSNDPNILYPYKGYVPGIIEYVEWFLHNITQYTDPNVNHTSFSTCFPNPTKGNEQEALPTSHGSIWSYLQWYSNVELHDRVDVFDMHQQPLKLLDDIDRVVNGTAERHTHEKRNLLADFVCQMLPTATKTCHYLDKETSDDQFRKRINDSLQQIVSNQDMYRIKQMAKRQGRKIKKAPSAMQIPAPIVTRWFRKQEKLNNTKSLKRCLGNETLEQLKIASWKFLLQQILLVRKRNSEHRRSLRSSDLSPAGHPSALFRSSTPTGHLLLLNRQEQLLGTENDFSDVPWIVPIKARHDQSFAEHVARGVFCEIDVERLFRNKKFIDYVLV